MSSRMRRPETVKIDISLGDWILVKKHLTAGENRAMFARMMKAGVVIANGEPVDTIDRARIGWSKMISYLLDWSITDADDQPVVIRDKSDEEIGASVDALDMDAFREIREAIEAHEEAVAKEIEQQKKIHIGEPG